mgnify:CR=1 FL=1
MKKGKFKVVRDERLCDQCGGCISQCANKVHYQDQDQIKIRHQHCVNCQRCVEFCHCNALSIIKEENVFHPHPLWSQQIIEEISKQANSGGILLSSMGTQQSYPIYFDHLLLNASQVTNPSIDPLREPIETTTFLGKRTHDVKRSQEGKLEIEAYPSLKLNTPILFSAMSFGSISFNAHQALLEAAKELGIYYNCGEGGLLEAFYKDQDSIIVQVASGRFGIDPSYLNHSAAVEIKIGQGAKPGIGGHLPSIKNKGLVSKTRRIKEYSESISPAPHHDIYSIEDLKQLVDSLKEATHHQKPIIVKVAAVHNIAAICSGIARSGADIIYIDGFKGGTGAAPTRIRDHVGIPIELALASVDETLRKEGIRENVSLIAAGGIRHSADVVKAIALGADAVAIGTAALIALGCHLCSDCMSGTCNWGIATQEESLCRRLNAKKGAQQLVNLIQAWTREIQEMMGGMGINAIESLRGNRLMLRGIHLSAEELDILGVKHAGR